MGSLSRHILLTWDYMSLQLWLGIAYQLPVLVTVLLHRPANLASECCPSVFFASVRAPSPISIYSIIALLFLIP
ncbi:Aldehyde reductase 2 [Fusarium oxysporum f. sp. albedinis]|nr:Aldehyde reductase 2 [Fusarium oxysporum f. sp. albedinis]